MKYKNILIHLDHSSGCRNRLEVAFGLARDFDAELIGVFVVPTYIVPSYVEAQISVDLMTDITEKALVRAEETVASYRQLAEEVHVKLQTGVVEGQIIPILREHSKYADLLILGQDHPEDPDNSSYGLADALLFEGACACLVVPHSGKLATPSKRVHYAKRCRCSNVPIQWWCCHPNRTKATASWRMGIRMHRQYGICSNLTASRRYPAASVIRI